MTLQILVDVNDDGIFDPNTESLTHDVLEVRWRSGLASPYDSVAQIGEAEIIVRNSDQAYSPELSAFTIGKRVCIRSQEGDTTRTLFVGILALIVPDSGNYGVKTTRLIAHDALATLHHADVRLNPQVQHTADVILQDILAHAPLRPTVLYGRWLLGQPNQSELGQNTRFVPPPRHHLAVGQTTFAYVSDTWQDGISANHAIEEVVSAERGRFFVNRDGEFVFLDRHALLKQDTARGTLTDAFDALHYDYGRDTLSQITVVCRPRTLGEAGTVVWQATSAMEIPPHSTQRFRVAWRDNNQNPIGALSLIAPARNTDFRVNTDPYGNGTWLTEQFLMQVMAQDLSGATLEIRNTLGVTAYLVEARVRGTPLHLDAPMSVTHIQHNTRTRYAVGGRVLMLSALDRVSQAEAVARFELSRHKTPQGHIHQLTLNVRHHSEALTYSLFDRVTLAVTHVGHTSDYFIVAEAHHIQHGGATHHLTWFLEPTAAHCFWLLGKRRLRQDTTLAY